MDGPERTYLSLGDSMSIDDYTGVEGGGAVSQFFRWLGEGWTLDDRTCDGCRMEGVPVDGKGDLITLTIGGNDLLWNKEEYLARGLSGFAREHLALLQAIRAANPRAEMIVGDVYRPAAKLTEAETEALSAANRAIQSNCFRVGARLAPIHRTFLGNEARLLCFQIEPTLQGAEAITELFKRAHEPSG
jgi:hypothetical protein